MPLVQQKDMRTPEWVDGLWKFKNWPTEYAERLWDGLELFTGAATALGVWLDASAVLKDWTGLNERTQQRAKERAARPADPPWLIKPRL